MVLAEASHAICVISSYVAGQTVPHSSIIPNSLNTTSYENF